MGQLNFELDVGHYLLTMGRRRMYERGTGRDEVLHGLENQKTQRNIGRV